MSAAHDVPQLQLADGAVSFDDAEDVFVVDPDADLLRELVYVWSESENAPPLRLLVRNNPAEAAFEDFHLASRASGLLEADLLGVRTLGERADNTLCVAEDHLSVFVPTDEGRYQLATDDGRTVESVTGRYEAVWEESDERRVRAASRRQIATAFRERLGDELTEDLLALFDAVPELYREDPANQYALTLLAGARHEALHYEIRRAGEDAGLASQATFSRLKNVLEDEGLVATEKVPVEVGRPRQRLVLADDELREAPLEAIPALVREKRSVA